MSAEQQRKLLEALMGKEALHGSELPKVHFSDDSVCKDYICGICPNDLFINTKMDIGACTRVHSEELRQQYQQCRKDDPVKTPSYEHQWATSLATFIDECDRKTQQTLRKMEKNPDDSKAIHMFRELSDLEYEVTVLLDQVQSLGEDGKIEESIRLLHTVEFLLQRKEKTERDLKLLSVGAGATQIQKLRVCYRCSASLSIFDSDRRLADHFAGKMHLGFVAIRDKLEELKTMGLGVRDKSDYNRRMENRDYSSRDSRRSYDRRRSRSPDRRGRR